MKGDRSRVVLDQLPYNVNKALMITKIAELVNNKAITGISDIRDESDRKGLRVALELKKGEITDVIINQLYKYTDFQVTFGCNMLALDNGLPRLMNVKHMIDCWITHRVEVVRRRTLYELNKAEARAHILEGYLKGLDNLDEIVNLIKKSPDKKVARHALITKYDLSERQADAFLELRLYQLTGLEREKIQKEYDELTKKIEYLRSILASEKMVKNIIISELNDVLKFDKTKRLTTIAPFEDEGLEMEDLIANEPLILTISSDDYIKRMPIDTFREQRRGGHGVIGIDIRKDAEGLKDAYVANSHDHLLVFSSFGRCYWLKSMASSRGFTKIKRKSFNKFIRGDFQRGRNCSCTKN